jgi:hypothetical protein
MPNRRRSNPPLVDPSTATGGRGGNGGLSVPRGDWSALLRRVERKRRLLARDGGNGGAGDGHGPSYDLPEDYYARATYATFRLEGLDVTAADVLAALAPAPQGPGGERPMLRPRQAQRLRNHAAILHHLENDLRQGLALTTDGVVRWYVAVSAGLSTTGLDQATAARVEDVVRRINSPQMRLQGALHEVALTHVRLLDDPLVPSFNGILARLLLRYHLGRCKLPAVVFDPEVDGRFAGPEALVRRLVELLNRSYDGLLGKPT